MTSPHLLLAIVFLLSLASCSSTYRQEVNFARLYNSAASSQEVERSPVIVIPGILGSRLRDSDSGELVWGSFLGGFADPSTPEGVRKIALPLSAGGELNELSTKAVPDGVLGRITVSLLGLPIRLNAYYHILRALGVGGYRDQEIAEAGAVDYGDGHFSCFQFPFDWRRDISASAVLLDEYILEQKKYVEGEILKRFGEKREVKFILVAHSMGGLLARYYLRYGAQPLPSDGSLPELTWGGAENVSQVVFVGTPSAGSIQSFNDLINGKDFGLVVPTYPAGVLGTMPAVYQLLPRSRHGAFSFSDGAEIEDVLNPELWEELEWGLLNSEQDEILQALLPGLETREERLEVAKTHVRLSLARAKQFQRAIDLPASPPKGMHFTLFAGDAIPTRSAALIDRDSGEIELVGDEPGDGLVTRSSALMDERLGSERHDRLVSPVHWDNVMFLATDHLELTRDPVFVDNILYTVLEAPLR